MSDSEFGWQSMLYTDSPPRSTLKGALFTTYDRPDEHFLVEHLLPSLLKLGYEPDSEGEDRQYFLLELDRRLKQLHNRITIISSVIRDEPSEIAHSETSAYGWIWRSIRSLTVGCRGKAVQHAKLWLLHWGATDEEDTEYLEIVISSANLTRSAFRGQIQAVWRVCLKLHAQPTKKRLTQWGVLPVFVNELGKSSNASEHLASFINLLGRASCPDQISFVASIPGIHSRNDLRRNPWGIAGLKNVKPSGRGTVKASVFSPYIGNWNTDTLRAWCRSFEGDIERLELTWIAKNHPWAGRWFLPKTTLITLEEAGTTLLQLRHSDKDPNESDDLHDNHHHTDQRWSHAKIYALSRGRSRRLLITSANFSTAAWGKENRNGSLAINNFELGVCIDQAEWPLSDLCPFIDLDDAATTSELAEFGESLLTWGQARWDGKAIFIECRCLKGYEVEARVICKAEIISATNWTLGKYGNRFTQIKWKDATYLPSIQLICENERLELIVYDERSLSDTDFVLPPDIDENTAQIIQDELLFDQYGGHIAAMINGRSNATELVQGVDQKIEGHNIESGHSDSYGVPVFESARRYFQIVDNWVVRVEKTEDEYEKQLLKHDGKLLLQALQREEKRGIKSESTQPIGSKLAGEELSLWIKHFWEV